MMEYKDYGSPLPDLDYPNFIEWLEAISTKNPESTAIYFRTHGHKEFTKWTFARFKSESQKFARGLLAAGLKKGDRVVLWSENCPEWMAVWMGTAIAGCTIVPVDFLVSEQECRNIIKLTQARVFVYSGSKLKFAGGLKEENFAASVGIEPADGALFSGEKNFSTFNEFGADAVSGGQKLPLVSEIAENDPVSIVFTSGTTGFAKGVTLSHRGIIANANAAIRMLRPRPEDIFINVLPLHHTYPTTCSFICPLTAGVGTIIVEKLVGKVVVDDIRDAGGTFLIAVPLLYDKVMSGIAASLAKLPPVLKESINFLRKTSLVQAKKGNPEFGRKALKFIRKKAGLASINIMVAGGGPLNPKTADFFDSLGFNIVHGYGMSENGPLISVSTPWHKNNVSVGLPVKYTDVKFADVNAEGTGEILVKSPSLMLGYYENPEATAEVFTPDGYLRTGDLGFMDELGFIYINGRKKNLIVSAGGKNIYPEEIESHFSGNTIIAEILVLGQKSAANSDERIFAVVYPNTEQLSGNNGGKKLDNDELRAAVKREIEAVNRTLPGYKKIVDFALADKPFEKNAQQKIRRFLYLQQYNAVS